MQEKRIAIASDHAGCSLKMALVRYLEQAGYPTLDFGAYDPETPVDYPDQAARVAKALYNNEADIGILSCGSGIGMSIAINRYPFARGALVCNIEMARLARFHNNANVLVLGGRMIDENAAIECLKMFLQTPFEGGRHEARVKKLGELPRDL